MIARLASAAHGVVTREELLDARLTKGQIDRRVQSGALIVAFPGVYRAGHRAPNVEAHYLAAVKACGKGAVLSGLAAAHMFGLVKGAAPRPEVTAPTERRVKGVTTHRRRSMDPRDSTVWHRIPTTTVPRTLVLLPSLVSPDALARACHEAWVRHRTTPAQVDAALERQPNAAGAKLLRAIVAGDIPTLLSKLERGFRTTLQDAGLQLPVTNRLAGAHYVDCRWPERGLTVELDSYRFHATRHAWEQDHRRDRAARARGDQLRRYTWTDVFEEPEPMLAELTELLERPG